MREIEPDEPMTFDLEVGGPVGSAPAETAPVSAGLVTLGGVPAGLVQGEQDFALAGIVRGSGFAVRQQLEATEVMWGVQLPNDYFVESFVGGSTLRVTEEGGGVGGAMARNWFGGLRTTVLDVMGGRDLVVMQIEVARRPAPFNRATVRGMQGELVGTIVQRFAWASTRYDLCDPTGHCVARIDRPFYRFFHFNVSHGERRIGTIEKNWAGLARELYTQADTFMVRIDEAYGDQRVRKLLLAATVVIDLVHFERRRHGGWLGLQAAKRS